MGDIFEGLCEEQISSMDTLALACQALGPVEMSKLGARFDIYATNTGALWTQQKKYLCWAEVGEETKLFAHFEKACLRPELPGIIVPLISTDASQKYAVCVTT